jgi:hypothetical protein
MKRVILAALAAGTVITSALSLGAAARSEAQASDHGHYVAALNGIEAAHALLLARCDRAVDKEMCRAQAEGGEAIRVADIEASYRRTREATRNAQRARIEGRYLLARASCMALGGSKRDQCQINAHALRGRAMLEAAAPYETAS